MAGKQKFKYTGTLAKPIIGHSQAGLLVDELAHYQAERLRIADESVAKLPDLFKAHGVPEYDYLGLVIAMAREHVPGFNVVERAGRPTEWGDANKAEFRLDVDTVRQKTGISVVEAIKQVIRLDHWREKAKTMNLSALEGHYYKADARWVEIARKARAYESMVVPD